MREIIRRHNLLNGLLFSIAEFAFIVLVIGAFATYYLLHHRLAMALVAWGIVSNCAVVVYFGIRQVTHTRAHGKSVRSYWNRSSREQHRRENPHLLRDTLCFTITALLPFVMLLAVWLDLPRRRIG